MASRKASLLVVGKRGHRDEHGGLLGTNTELLARRVQVPILMTPKRFRPIREVVVAYAGKGPGAWNLAAATQLCNILNVRLRVATVAKDVKSGEQVLAQPRDMLRDGDVPTTFEVLRGRVAMELSKTTTRESLLVLGASNHSRAYHLLLGNVTVEAMRSASGPVLLSSKLDNCS
jgi:nucleotide-binding universal stress UspA family protein